jgi:hypothetical protein
MTDDERLMRLNEGVGDGIEDLEAPAAALDDVAGGKTICSGGTCQGDSTVSTFCHGTCSATTKTCKLETAAVVVSLL